MLSEFSMPRCRQTDIDNEAGAWSFQSEAKGTLELHLGVMKSGSRDGIGHGIVG